MKITSTELLFLAIEAYGLVTTGLPAILISVIAL